MGPTEKCHYNLQEIARGKGSGNDDAITLDVHAINKLQKELNLDPTDESPKYKYTSDAEGNYGKWTYSNTVILTSDASIGISIRSICAGEDSLDISTSVNTRMSRP